MCKEKRYLGMGLSQLHFLEEAYFDLYTDICTYVTQTYVHMLHRHMYICYIDDSDSCRRKEPRSLREGKRKQTLDLAEMAGLSYLEQDKVSKVGPLRLYSFSESLQSQGAFNPSI